MVNALKKIDKKVLIIGVSIILLPIVIVILMAIIQGCSNSKTTHSKYEQKMISAAQKYFKDKDNKPTKEGQTVTVKLSKLVDGEYIKSPEKMLDDETCEGSVTARLNGSVIEENKGGFVNYTVNLECKNYNTNTLEKAIIDDLTTSGSGVYKQGSDYIFKGEDVDNYITFFGSSYRIVSMDDKGIVKLLKADNQINQIWDNKYNIDTKKSTGKNIYADSLIRKSLLNIYNNPKKITAETKKHIVSRNVCIGPRNVADISSTSNSECSNILSNEVMSLVSVSDYASASLDPDCVNLTSRSCMNYNYMRTVLSSSWTSVSVSGNSYEVFVISNGLVYTKTANERSSYKYVIYIDGDEIILSGEGTDKSPYIIK